MRGQGILVSPAHGIIEFEGPDAQSFLQSQLTHDVGAIEVGRWQWQGYCTAKGRLVATFALARVAEGRYLALAHASLTALLVKRLSLFRLRAKLTIAESARYAAAFHLGAQTPELPADALLWSIQPDVHLAIVPRDEAQAMASSDDLNALACRRIAARQPEVTAEISERFVPQMIAWDRVAPGGGVSFSKGCYPGQEVVARAHYRGAVKKGLELHRHSPDTPGVLPGATIVLADGREADVVNVARCDGKWAVLVVAQHAESGPAQS